MAKRGQHVNVYFSKNSDCIELKLDAPQEKPCTGWIIDPHMKPCTVSTILNTVIQ